MQPVMQKLLAESIEVEEGRPRMVKAPSRIISEQFVEVLRTLYLKSVGSEIRVLEDGDRE